MKFSIEYSNGVIQILYLINQKEWAEMQSTDEKDLTDRQKKIKKLFKAGGGATTESPIGAAFLRGDGKLILPTNQGGVHEVKTKLINEDKF